MNETAPDHRIHELVSGLHLSGTLGEAERDELESILAEDESAREIYLLHQELHAMLENDKTIRLALASDLLPDNVVAMPGIEAENLVTSSHEKGKGLPTTDPIGKSPSFQLGFRTTTSFAAMLVGLLALLWMYLKVAQIPGGQGFPNQGQGVAVAPEKRIDFHEEIRPILEDHCLECHGKDEQNRKANLRLDLADSALNRKEAVIIRGSAEKSELIARIRSSDPDFQMPPSETGDRLTEREIDLLSRWVDQGADFGGGWAILGGEWYLAILGGCPSME